MHYAFSFVYLISALSISLFSQNLGVVTIYNSDNSDLTYNQINCLEFVENGELWIGTQNGISIFNSMADSWINIPNKNLPSNIISALEFNNSANYSSMFVGHTEGITLALWDNTLIETELENITWDNQYGAACSPNNGIISSILYDNELWSGSTDGLCVEGLGPEGTWLIQNTSTEFYSNNITSIKKNTNNGMIAIGTMNGGLVTYDGTFNIYYSSNSDILDNSVLDVAFDQNNNIIICTPQAGLGVLTEGGSWIWFNTVNSSLPSNSLKNVIVDNNNNLWITTLENGLIQYKNNVFYNYTTENSDLPDNKINCLQLGENNQIWLGTETSGLIKINTPITSINGHNPLVQSISPTIFDSKIHIDLLESGQIYIYNQYGQLIDTKILSIGNNYINTTDYTSGLYFILTESRNKRSVNTVIKQTSSTF
jgi:ligand-binding sensor domain-containing protein